MAILTVDIGTTSTKVVLFDRDLNQLELIKQAYPTRLGFGGFAEQDPGAIYLAVLTGIEKILMKRSVGVSRVVFSSAMHSLMGVDRAGAALTPLVIWSDSRALVQVDRFKGEPEAGVFFEKTGTPIHPMSPFAKLLWYQEESSVYDRVAKWIGIKEYIWFRLTGEYQIDYSIASATGLFNSVEFCWDEQILDVVGLDEGAFSEAVDVSFSCAVSSTELLDVPGIDRETLLVIGGSDGCLANLASVVADSRIASLTVGTSGAIRLTTGARVIDPDGCLFCYYLRPGEWVIGGAVNNGGNVLSWLDQLLFEEPGQIYDLLGKINFDHESGLIFLPHIHGERAPFWDSHLTGEWIGLRSVHGKQDLVQSALEGMLFNLFDVFNLLDEYAGPIEAVRVSGGFFQTKAIIQVVANLFGIKVKLNQTIEQSSLGAAMLATSDVRVSGATETTYLPDDEKHAMYQARYQKYQQALRRRK